MRAALVLVLLAAAVPAQDTHPFSVHDMLAMERISDARVSPDGRWVSFTVRTTDVDANKGRTDIWLAATDGSGARRLTTDPGADGNARWLDADSLVFLSSRGGSSQVWNLAIDGGEAAPLSNFPVDVDNLEVFPGSHRLLLGFDVWPAAKSLKDSAEMDAARSKQPGSARIYDSLLFRHWDTWEDGKRSHVFAWDLGAPEPVDLMRGMDADAPTKPFGDFTETSIAPDGKTVAFVARVAARENAWHTNTDVFLVPSDASAPPRAVTAENLGYDQLPCFSPDGRTLAWLSMPRAGYESDRQQLMLLDVASGSRRKLAPDWDRSASEITWSRDGKTIYATADNVGCTSLFAIDVLQGTVKMLVERGTSAAPLVTGTDIVYQHDTLASPVELFALPAAGGEPRALTQLNARHLAAARMGKYEPFTFTGAHGDTVHGYVVQPVDLQPGKQYPTVMLIHGGPQSTFGDHFGYRWNPQIFAGAGFGVVFIDFHGSTGYGQAFCDSIRGDWGGAPFTDILTGLDAAVANFDYLDGTRVAAAGGSFGGYMINWIAGAAPDRFKALVCHDGNLDERMAYYDTEELWFPEWDHGGTPWDGPDGFTRHNPIDLVGKWKTPMLVIHGRQDYRVVDTQGMATFTALQRRGIPSRLVYFTDENHWITKPQDSLVWYEQVLGWIKEWTAK
ncbi:MAG TPA: S9 family peptidase [Planctomycetota bacterium]|nr:S9 family peptidase [Planctomycetota bacterium]